MPAAPAIAWSSGKSRGPLEHVARRPADRSRCCRSAAVPVVLREVTDSRPRSRAGDRARGNGVCTITVGGSVASQCVDRRRAPRQLRAPARTLADSTPSRSSTQRAGHRRRAADPTRRGQVRAADRGQQRHAQQHDRRRTAPARAGHGRAAAGAAAADRSSPLMPVEASTETSVPTVSASVHGAAGVGQRRHRQRRGQQPRQEPALGVVGHRRPSPHAAGRRRHDT